MNSIRPFYFGLICLSIASLCTFLAFVIVYRYVSFVRPIERFAIVVDAGSTKTRSNLYHIRVDSAEKFDADQLGSARPLNELIKVKELSSCVNGAPIASIQSSSEAKRLILPCLAKFKHQIKLLKFVDSSGEPKELDECASMENLPELTAIRDHRVNSVTQLYLGATAGLRSLNQLHESQAQEKLYWLRAALEANELNEHEERESGDSPKVNSAFVDILSGFDEAKFSWLSTNFLCTRLEFRTRERGESRALKVARATVGTLELGGSSAQIAFQSSLELNQTLAEFERNNLSIFNVPYSLSARSDQCIGLSQAEQRANLMAIRRELNNGHDRWMSSALGTIELESPCLSAGAQMEFTRLELLTLANSPCLVGPEASDDPIRVSLSDQVKIVKLVGTGNVDQCSAILSNMLESASCKRHFELCPGSRPRSGPPSGIPFITISAFNKVLSILDLKKSAGLKNELELEIENKLGGHSVDYENFKQSLSEFCATPIDRVDVRYPKLHKEFRDITCFRLHYIDRLLREFYGFSPSDGTWKQLKFLIFPPDQSHTQSDCPKIAEVGWSVGLLLNATNEELSRAKFDDSTLTYFHHTPNWRFILRTLLMLLFACLLSAVGLFLAGFFIVSRWRRQDYADFAVKPKDTQYDVQYV